ncbi:MAG: hypothetical protein QM715_09895 [Nibricoccus sp.]
MLTTLRLKPTLQAAHKASAWFIPGEDPNVWLTEIAGWSIPTEQVKFCVISAIGSNQTKGVLAIPPANTAIPPGFRGLPYYQIAPDVFVPIGTTIMPPIDATEWSALHRYEALIYHPSFGITGYEKHDIKYAWDFLAPPRRPASTINWSAARTPILLNQRLRSVRLEAPLQLTEIFGEESREIGSEPATNLPPTSDETRKLPGKIAEGIGSVFVRTLIGLTSLVPRNPHVSANWINHLENWAQTKLAGLTDELSRQRHKELFRLLEMLENNPEEGLKHAISLAALAHRGKAPPSSQLSRRILDFNLGRLGGNRPSDFWAIPGDVQSNLSKRYRENAVREAKLGQYRRAAYIYAELLGDLNSAADVLKQGKFFREAALLYQERLHRPLLAAECLAGGGFAHEAIEIYTKHSCWLEIANIYRDIGDSENESKFLRKWIDLHLAKGDTLTAVRFLETRLKAVDEALNLLQSTWPSGKQALQCLEERFAILSRHNRTPDLTKLIAELGDETTAARQIADLVGLVSRTAENAAHQEVRKIAAEVTRAKISSALTDKLLESHEEIAVLRALVRLTPKDRLLARDVNRFRDGGKKIFSKHLPPPTQFTRKLVPDKGKALSLPHIGIWAQIEGGTTGFTAVATRNGPRIFFTRGTWEGEQQSADWADSAPEMKAAFLLKMSKDVIFLARPFSNPLALTDLPGTDVFNRSACKVGTPSWLPADTVRITEARGIFWIVRVVSNRVVLASYHSEKLVHSRDITDEIVAAAAEVESNQLYLESGGTPTRIVLAYGKSLLIMSDQAPLTVIKLEKRIIGVLPSPPSMAGWIVLLDRGVSFVSAEAYSIASLDDTMPMPRGTYLQDGRLVVLSGGDGKVFQCHEGRMHEAGWFSLPSSNAVTIGLSGTNIPHELAVFDSSGAITRWHIPV